MKKSALLEFAHYYCYISISVLMKQTPLNQCSHETGFKGYLVKRMIVWRMQFSYCTKKNKQGLSKIPGFTIASHSESPIVYLRLKNSMGSLKEDLHLLENIVERVLKERFCICGGFQKIDIGHWLHKASESLKRVATLVFDGHK